MSARRPVDSQVRLSCCKRALGVALLMWTMMALSWHMVMSSQHLAVTRQQHRRHAHHVVGSSSNSSNTVMWMTLTLCLKLSWQL